MSHEKQLIIVAIKGLHTQPVFGPALPQIVQSKRTELKKLSQWKGWRFQLRTPEGYKHIKILTKNK